MLRKSVALSSIALAAAASFGTSPGLDGRLGVDRDGRLGVDRDGRVGLASAGKFMSPAELVARSTYLARKRQTHRKSRR